MAEANAQIPADESSIPYAWFLYVVECSDGSLYTGISTDVARRIGEHLGLFGRSRGAKYFSGRSPTKLHYVEGSISRSEASKREAWVKSLTRSKKWLLCREGEQNLLKNSINIAAETGADQRSTLNMVGNITDKIKN